MGYQEDHTPEKRYTVTCVETSEKVSSETRTTRTQPTHLSLSSIVDFTSYFLSSLKTTYPLIYLLTHLLTHSLQKGIYLNILGPSYGSWIGWTRQI